MEKALVVIDDTAQSKELLRKAAVIAEGVGTKLYLFSTLDPAAFDEEVATLDAIAEIENTTYSDQDALQSIHSNIQEIVTEVFDDPPFEYETVGAVRDDDDRASAIIDAADTFDCEHIFLTGRSRSPTGKALFGDTVQSVLLTFDGEVTVHLD